MTPNEIDVLLWCHCRPEKHERYDAPAVREAHEWMLTAGLIKAISDDGYYVTTERGDALVEMLCNTPLPVWADPREIDNA